MGRLIAVAFLVAGLLWIGAGAIKSVDEAQAKRNARMSEALGIR